MSLKRLAERVVARRWQDDRGHVWALQPNGEPDYEEPLDGHGGPRCTRCDYWFCQHCHDGPQEDCKPEEEP